MNKENPKSTTNGAQASNSDMSSQDTQQTKQEFSIQRIYVKDISYEAPNTPQTFRGEWNPMVNLEVDTKAQPLEQNVHEVMLTVTVTAKMGETTAFLAEVRQAGIFTIRAFPDAEMGHLLGSYCPGMLFPYAREAISDLIVRGGFPSLYLAPLNFDALYQQHLAQQQGQASKQEEGQA